MTDSRPHWETVIAGHRIAVPVLLFGQQRLAHVRTVVVALEHAPLVGVGLSNADEEPLLIRKI
ncbi:MAG: hypothetical protein M3014_14745 [Chloroflexota bacterium]|nr:hypothetical protein [Chloroflexota bacterium]